MSAEREAVADEPRQLAEIGVAGLSSEQVMQCCKQPTDGGLVAKLPFKVYLGAILCMLGQAWSDQKVSVWLTREGYPISEKTVERFRKAHIEPVVGTRKELVAQKRWFEETTTAATQRQKREEVEELQRRRVKVIAMKESGVTSMEVIGDDPEKFEHVHFFYKDIDLLMKCIGDTEKSKRDEGALSELANGQGPDVVVEETTTHRKLSMKSKGRVLRVLEGLEPVEAITGRRPSDIVVTERPSSEDDDGGADDGTGTGATGAAGTAENGQ